MYWHTLRLPQCQGAVAAAAVGAAAAAGAAAAGAAAAGAAVTDERAQASS